MLLFGVDSLAAAAAAAVDVARSDLIPEQLSAAFSLCEVDPYPRSSAVPATKVTNNEYQAERRDV